MKTWCSAIELGGVGIDVGVAPRGRSDVDLADPRGRRSTRLSCAEEGRTSAPGNPRRGRISGGGAGSAARQPIDLPIHLLHPGRRWSHFYNYRPHFVI
jgi:hypothetical protein